LKIRNYTYILYFDMELWFEVHEIYEVPCIQTDMLTDNFRHYYHYWLIVKKKFKIFFFVWMIKI